MAVNVFNLDLKLWYAGTIYMTWALCKNIFIINLLNRILFLCLFMHMYVIGIHFQKTVIGTIDEYSVKELT